MPFPVLGSNSAVAEFAIDNSLRFNSNDSAYLSRTPSSAGNRGIWTVSCWVKKANPTKRTVLFGTPGSDNNSTMQFIFHQDSGIRFGLNTFNVFTTTNTFLMRDPSAWYHLLLRIDTSQGSSDNRTKFYINGERFTDFDGNNLNNITNGFQYGWNNTIAHTIGAEPTPGDYMDGHIAEFYNIDGQSLAPTEFGEFNDNGVWVPKEYEGTYGTNGFFLEFQDSGNLGDDTSGNGNDFTANNLTATDQTTDTPTNNFCTYNAVDTSSNITLSEGNTLATANSNHSASRATIGLRNGKWYWENKIVSVSGGPAVGVIAANASLGDQLNANPSRFYRNNGEKFSNGSGSSYGNSYTTNDIIGVALDLDNGAIYFYKNGTIENSGTAAFTDLLTATTEHWLPAVKLYDEAISINFGNPSHSISSGNSDANGYGNFEYAVPTGYYSLCTKNLAEYGG